MEAFAARLGDRALVLGAAARSRDHPLPYQPVAEIFRSVPDWDALTSAVQPIWLAEAARLLPELRELCPDLPRPLAAQPSEARTRLLEALCRLMMQLSVRRRPLLLCLDDLHWADSATLDWLFCLARHLAERPAGHSPILILGTYRTEERETVDDLRRRLVRLGILSKIRLPGLGPASVLQIVRQLTNAHPGTETLSLRLHSATGGNPFFRLETLRALQETGRLTGDLNALNEIPLPNTIRQAIQARLRRLSPQARQILEAGAVLGVSFDFELVRRTAGRDDIKAIDSLDEAVAGQLLVEHRVAYRFRHAPIQRTVEGTLGPVRRHLLHRRAAQALEELEPQAAGRIAHHFDLGSEEERALHYYRRAAQQAKAVFAWQAAVTIHSRMLELLDWLDPARSNAESLAHRGEILASRAHLRFLQGRPEERDADLAALDALAASSDDDGLRLLTALHQVRYHNLGGRYGDAIAEGKRGIVLARRLNDTAAESRLLAKIGFAHYFLGNPQPALVALESGMGVSGEQMDPISRGRISQILGYVYYHMSDYTRGLACHEEAYECSREIEDHNRMAWTLMDVGFLHLKLGHPLRAKQCLDHSLALARQIAARPAEAYALTLLGDWELYGGDYAAAVELSGDSLAIQVEVGSKHGIVAAENGAGLALCQLGDLSQARRTLQRGLEHAREIGHTRHIALALIGLGLVEISDNSLSLAYDELVEALTIARDSECPENVILALPGMARAQRRQGDPAAALESAIEAKQTARERGLRPCEAWADLEAGLALLIQGKGDQALQHTVAAVEAVPDIHEAWIGSEEIRRAHARVLQALARVEEAREQMRLAKAVIQVKGGRIPDPQRRQRYLQYVSHNPASLVPQSHT